MNQATVTIDAGELPGDDACVVDALARLALALRRGGLNLRLVNVPASFNQLADFMGLAAALGVEMDSEDLNQST